MLRILFADDQIPDDSITDDAVLAAIKEQYPRAQAGFIRAFVIMRRAVKAMRDNYDVTVARRFNDALALVRDEHFDVAIIDLGWYADHDLKEAERATAGWKLADAIDEADARHLERPATAQIIYSARFATDPALSGMAANKGRLPFFKPYKEAYTIPLESSDIKGEDSAGAQASYQSLRAAVSFIEHLRTSEQRRDRDLNTMRQTVIEGWRGAVERERRWDLLTRILLATGILLVLSGVLAAMFLGVPQGAVTSASGVVVALIPKLLYGELEKTRKEIREAKDDIEAWLVRVRSLDSDSSAAAPPGLRG